MPAPVARDGPFSQAAPMISRRGDAGCHEVLAIEKRLKCRSRASVGRFDGASLSGTKGMAVATAGPATR